MLRRFLVNKKPGSQTFREKETWAEPTDSSAATTKSARIVLFIFGLFLFPCLVNNAGPRDRERGTTGTEQSRASTTTHEPRLRMRNARAQMMSLLVLAKTVLHLGTKRRCFCWC